MLQTILLQVDSTATAANAQSINYLSLLLKGGIVIYPILFLLFIALFFIIERYLFIKAASNIDFGFLRSLKDNILRGDLRTAATLCKSTNLPIARILEKGITRIGRPVKDIESAMEIQSNLEVSKMEKNMGYLGLIAGIAPILGFIGTILGIILAFFIDFPSTEIVFRDTLLASSIENEDSLFSIEDGSVCLSFVLQDSESNTIVAK